MIPVTHISEDDLVYLYNIIGTAIENGQYLRLSQQSGRVMFARGQSVWTAPMGEDKTVRPSVPTDCDQCGAGLVNEDCPNYGNGAVHA